MFTRKYESTHLKLKHPFSVVISGPSGSGKSELTRDIINNFNITTNIEKSRVKVLWCYSLVESIKPLNSVNVEVSFHEGVPSLDEIRSEAPDILILDDLMLDVAKNNEIADIFIKGSHHLKMSVCFLVQNIFAEGKAMRNITLQAKYLIFMKSVRDQGQFKAIAKQTSLNYDSLLKAYKSATQQPFSYLLLDLTQETPVELRLRSKITPRFFGGSELPLFAPQIFR